MREDPSWPARTAVAHTLVYDSLVPVNAVVAHVTALDGGQVADGFGAFTAIADAEAGGDTCAAGLINRLTRTSCYIHPSPRGRDVLARAVKAVVNLPDHED